VLLKSDRIAELLISGARDDAHDPLVITPSPNNDELKESGSASLDLRLGTWFANRRETRVPCLRVDDPFRRIELDAVAAQLAKAAQTP
jgi:hypothetical protein